MVGSGGREHALASVLGRDAEVVVVPGNPGIPNSLDAAPEDVEADLFVIGPEAPLVDGLADRLRAAGRLVFGPGADGARLEGSKAWMKDLLADAGVPTARHGSFTEPAPALEFLDTMAPPFVVKTDGLAAGKGVVVTDDRTQALLHGEACLAKGGAVLIEEYLDGPEASVFCISDGTTVVPLLPAQDFKRVGEGDTGPNTGGMGAYSPLTWADPDLAQWTVDHVAQPAVDEMAARGIPYTGVLYVGLALTRTGPRVVEFNARFGDPETQAVLALLETPLAGLLVAAARGELADHPPLEWRDGAAVTVVLAAAGYPQSPRTGDVIHGADAPGVLHAGTALRDGEVVSSGGRVLNVVATGATLEQAREAAYATLRGIRLDGGHYRRDIAATLPDQQETSR